MEMTNDSQDIETSSPRPLKISPEFEENDKICIETPDFFTKEELLTDSPTPSPPHHVYSDSDKGNMSPLTQGSRSPPASQELDLLNIGFSDGDFALGDPNMEAPGKRRLKEWLVEQINSGRYEGLKWLSTEKTLFSVPWKHAREKTYCMDKDAALYKEWASYSGKHRKSEANPINWKLNFRCALYSVRGIKERKDIYIRGHRVYELTDNAGDTPCKEYPQVPTRIPGFPKLSSETPDELSSCDYEDTVKALTADIFPNYTSNSQPHIHINSQSESLSSQQSVTAKFNSLSAFETSQGEVTPNSPTMQFNRSYIVMPGAVPNSHLSPLTPIPFDPMNTKISSLLTSPSTPILPSLHRVDAKHDMSGLSLIFPTHQSTVPYKKKMHPTTPYSLPSTPSGLKLSNGSGLEVPCSSSLRQAIPSPSIASPANPFRTIGIVAMPSTPTLPYPLQAPMKATPYLLNSEAATQYLRPDAIAISNNSLRQNLSLCQYLKQENYFKHNLDLDCDNPTQKRSHENTTQLEIPNKKRRSPTSIPVQHSHDLTKSISTVEMHTCGDPVRIITSGYPEIPGDSVLEKRRYAQEHFDHLRSRLMLEPRGHSDMMGVLPVTADNAEADIGVLFLDSAGYSPMCGHCIISVGRYALDYKLVKPQAPETKINIQCPCGLVKVFVEYSNGKSGRVRFHSVPAFVYAQDLEVHLEDYGRIRYDIAFGGLYYVIATASQFDLDLKSSPTSSLSAAGISLAQAVMRTVKIEHPEAPEIGFLAGTILVDDNDQNPENVSANFCVLKDGQVARGPCGSGVTARIALQYYKRLTQLGDLRTFSGPSGGFFTGRALREETRGDRSGIVVEVSGQGYYTGENKFTFEKEDPLSNGFSLK